MLCYFMKLLLENLWMVLGEKKVEQWKRLYL